LRKMLEWQGFPIKEEGLIMINDVTVND
jgi:hypothetical protein